MVFGANLIWGLGYPLYNMAMPHYIEPYQMLTLSTIATALLTLLAIPFEGAKAKQQSVARRDILTFVGAALLIAVGRKGILMLGLSMTSAIDCAIIATLNPVVVLIFSALLGFEIFTRGKLFGVILGLAGAVGVILSGANGAHATSGVEGNLLIVLCAILAAVYMLWFKSLLKRYEPIVALRWMFLLAAVAVVPFGVKPMMEWDYSQIPTKVWFAIAYLAIMTTYIPNLLLQSGLRRLQPTVTSVYTYVQPATAVIFSIALGIDKLRVETAIFGALIFAGVWIVIRAQRRVTMRVENK